MNAHIIGRDQWINEVSIELEVAEGNVRRFNLSSLTIWKSELSRHDDTTVTLSYSVPISDTGRRSLDKLYSLGGRKDQMGGRTWQS